MPARDTGRRGETERWLGELALALQEETYRPDPIRRVYIPIARRFAEMGLHICRSRPPSKLGVRCRQGQWWIPG